MYYDVCDHDAFVSLSNMYMYTHVHYAAYVPL